MIKVNLIRTQSSQNWVPLTKNNFSKRMETKIGRKIASNYRGISDQKAEIKIFDQPIRRFVRGLFGKSSDNLNIKVRAKLTSSIRNEKKQLKYTDNIKFKELRELDEDNSEIIKKDSFLSKIHTTLANTHFNPSSKKV